MNCFHTFALIDKFRNRGFKLIALDYFVIKKYKFNMISLFKQSNIYPFLWMLFAFVLPFSKAYPNIVLILILISFIVFKKYKDIKFNLKDGFMFFIVAVFWITISILLQDGFSESLKPLRNLYSLIAIYFLAQTIATKKYYVLLSFIAGTVILFLLSIIGIVTFYLNHGFVKLDIGSTVNEMLHGERPYIGFMLALSVYFSLHIIRKAKKRWLYIWVLIATSFIFIRLATVLSILIVIHHLYILFKTKKVYLLMGFFAITILIIAAFTFNENFKNRMRIENDVQSTYAKFKAYEPRFVIWECATELSQQINPLLGFGNYKTMKSELVNCYVSKIPSHQSSKIAFYEEKAFNTHDQFFSFLLLGGWLPFFCLILFFVVSFAKSNTYLYSFTLLFFLSFFIFENVLYRQLGVYLMGLFLGLLNTKQNETVIKSE